MRSNGWSAPCSSIPTIQCAYNAACTYAQLGETDQAFDALENWAETSR